MLACMCVYLRVYALMKREIILKKLEMFAVGEVKKSKNKSHIEWLNMYL